MSGIPFLPSTHSRAMRNPFCALLLAIGACSGAPPPADPVEVTAPAAADWQVTPFGIGALRAGVTLSEASAVLGVELTADYEMFDECDHVEVPNAPGEVWLMVVSDTVQRVEVGDSAVATTAGIRVGDRAERVLAQYGDRVTVEPHVYTDGHYLIVRADAAADSLYQIVFETYEGAVTRFRSGLYPAVQWVEGCA
jgi:hypothetical protein